MEERRRGMEELKQSLSDVIKKVDHLQSYIESEFGGHGLNGQATEGNTTRQLREISTRVAIQNGRVSKLENWRSYVIGIGGACGGILTLLTLLVAWIKK